jgi:hypothetical protein
MKTNCKMTDVSTTEMREAVGGLSFATINFLRTTHNLSRMQVSALKYVNRLDDPAKFGGIVPDGPGAGMQDPTKGLG